VRCLGHLREGNLNDLLLLLIELVITTRQSLERLECTGLKLHTRPGIIIVVLGSDQGRGRSGHGGQFLGVEATIKRRLGRNGRNLQCMLLSHEQQLCGL
jgi:hypothetical protein